MSLLIKHKGFLLILLIIILIVVMFIPYSPVKLFILYDMKHYALQMDNDSENPYDMNRFKMIKRDDILFIYGILKTGNFQFHPILTETPPDWSLFTFYVGDIRFYYSMKTFRENLVVKYHGSNFVIHLKEGEMNKLFTFFKVNK